MKTIMTETTHNYRACRLWYRQPAGSFLDALPIGNGRIGGMVYGGVFHNTKYNDHIALCARDLEQAGAHAYDSLRAAHTAEHAA